MKGEICSETHDELPDIGSDAPYYWCKEAEASDSSSLTEDLCIIEGEEFFVRGVVEIPIQGTDDYFGWGVWVSLKKENFEIYRDNYDSSKIGPFFGWFATEIDYFSVSTINLQTTVKFVGGGTRPRIFINECDHKIRKDQRSGITFEEAWKIVHHYTDDG
ncbi:MAG: DUF2199 domain-containing protein [Verrucomicrobiota bacterium]